LNSTLASFTLSPAVRSTSFLTLSFQPFTRTHLPTSVICVTSCMHLRALSVTGMFWAPACCFAAAVTSTLMSCQLYSLLVLVTCTWRFASVTHPHYPHSLLVDLRLNST